MAEFSVDKSRAFSAMGHKSVAARHVTSILEHYDTQLDEFVKWLFKEGHIDLHDLLEEPSLIDQFLASSKNNKALDKHC